MRLLLEENYYWISKIYNITPSGLIKNSTCKIKESGVKFLKSLLGDFELYLLYRGSQDGFYASKFHLKCDDKGPTISLLQIEDGDCIDGFTNAKWASGNGEYKYDNKAFLFNLDFERSFPCKRDYNA
jgi:hypothetical protein